LLCHIQFPNNVPIAPLGGRPEADGRLEARQLCYESSITTVPCTLPQSHSRQLLRTCQENMQPECASEAPIRSQLRIQQRNLSIGICIS
jgi:hypothetical protein